jgi:subtilisin family serine protease
MYQTGTPLLYTRGSPERGTESQPPPAARRGRTWPDICSKTLEESVTGQDGITGRDDMAEEDNWLEGLSPRIADEVRYVIDQFARHGVEVGAVFTDGGIDYLYAKNQILVRDEYLHSVLEILWRRENEAKAPAELVEQVAVERVIERVIAGVVLLSLEGTPYNVLEALDLIDERLGEGIATPNHVFTVAGDVSICPATEPQQVYEGMEPFPSACRTDDGAGVRVYVADTGLLLEDTNLPWLRGAEGEQDPHSPPWGGMPPIKPYTGHGTFVAGVARCMAPAAHIYVADVFSIAGSQLESKTAKKLSRGLRHGVDIFHLSMAATTRKDLSPLAIGKWLELAGQYKGVVCVVAAGNSGSYRPTWPSAFPEVVSVGALAADWRSRAEFSNFGGWVDVYAPGRDLINAYATGVYTCYAAPYAGEERKFYGMAKWSGTSFSAPVVTGLIAARMYRTGENGQEAAAALLAEARAQAIPGVGAILLPSCGNGPAPGQAGCCCDRQHRACSC